MIVEIEDRSPFGMQHQRKLVFSPGLPRHGDQHELLVRLVIHDEDGTTCDLEIRPDHLAAVGRAFEKSVLYP